ncbi:MAG: hypothetical protein V1875_01965 [Candidatus Altiarchaeota archaeon]
MDDESVLRHIRACDRMYEEVYGKPLECDTTSMCKMRMRLGLELSSEILPELCIRNCERWALNAAP